jgi:hypothetical protein
MLVKEYRICMPITVEEVMRGRDVPDTVFAGYPAGRISGSYKSRISGQISGKGRIPNIPPDTLLGKYILGKISNKFIKTALKIIAFCNF